MVGHRFVIAQRILELDRFAEARWPPEVFRRFQSVWLSMVMGLPSQGIANALGLHVSTVRRLRVEFERRGVSSIDGKGNRGGRRNQYLTFQEEVDFLREHADLLTRISTSGIRDLKEAFEARVGATVHKTTVYRLLERHGEQIGVPSVGRSSAPNRKPRRGSSAR
jgi:transposase